MNELPPGRYRHYKDKEYTVLGVARHSETHEEPKAKGLSNLDRVVERFREKGFGTGHEGES